MDRQKVINLFEQCRDEAGDLHAVFLFAKMVEKETLEKAANHFDERGKNKDGEWSSGYYEVDEPGEILRSLKISY